MATIDFKGWRIISDTECWMVGKPDIRINKRGEQEIYLKHPTYYPTLEQALGGLLQRELRASDASSAKEIIQTLRELKAEIRILFAEQPA